MESKGSIRTSRNRAPTDPFLFLLVPLFFGLPFSAGQNTLEEAERNQIHKTLSETRWRIEGKDGAAAILGLHPSTLRARIHKLGIVRPSTETSD